MSVLDGFPPDVLTGADGPLALLLARMHRVEVIEVVLVKRRQRRIDGGSRGKQGIPTTVGRGDQPQDGRSRGLKLESDVRVIQLDGGKGGPVGKRALVGVDDVDVFETRSTGNTGGRVNMEGTPVFAEVGLGFDRHVVLLAEDCDMDRSHQYLRNK